MRPLKREVGLKEEREEEMPMCRERQAIRSRRGGNVGSCLFL